MGTSRKNEIKSIFLFAIAVIIFISLLTFDQKDIKFLTSTPNISKSNIIGSLGAYTAWVLLFLMGFGAYLAPLFIVLCGTIPYLESETTKKIGIRIFGIFFSILAISSALGLLGPSDVIYKFQRGGILGLVFSDFLLRYLGSVGALIVIIVIFLLSLLITADFLIFPFIGWLGRLFKSFVTAMQTIPVNIRKPKTLTRKPAPQGEKLPYATETKPTEQIKKPETTKEKLVKVKDIAKSQTQKKETKPQKPQVIAAPYEFPSSELLNAPPPIEEREIKEDLEENSRILEETLRDFDIETKVVKVSKGPVITRYELEPASGVKVHRITSLNDNIALAMKSVSVRIIAPVPGKGTIGVEVPNLKSTFVYLRELLESKEFKEPQSKLKLVLGKDISGTPIVTDLDDMPHLLIAGATGSGKTVCVNSIITTLLFNASPDELKFLMVDPKRVELALFNELPHLLAPVVTEPKKVSHSLNWVVNEMDRRYEVFAQVAVRNIDGYNKKAKSENLPILPYIVVIIDELADLMLVAQQEIETMIARLAQLSRAVGIHMIIATQRPSVDVITGVIKANFPARISFKVATKVDSRTVIDMNGAEKLLGKGDMLFIEPAAPKPIRAQGSLLSDEEIRRIATFIKNQRVAEFEEEILKIEDKPSYKQFEKDEIYEEAVRLVIQTKQASVSMLQRRLGVGYTRAARLIDMMEDGGIIGPYQGSKPREILINSIDE
ncbi:MAG: hypothetical protein A2Y81_08785 [Nitrospirae bacterium RBG_13_43_8]|nr:MAG: hypothetical protein A2Y81_08785 [Nitrospirae bacterium RBG_13_43_8]